MRLKLLLFTILLSGTILAQEAYRGLVISEARLTGQMENYVEITNMGDKAVNLKDFKLGTIRPWNQAINDVFLDPWVHDNNRYIMLPDFVLQPGKSYVVASARDFQYEQYNKRTPGFEGGELPIQQKQMYELADLLIHQPEPKGDATDSITRNSGGIDISWMFENWNGRECMYIEQHLSDVDSVVIDQVNGVFDNAGQNRTSGRYDIAGVTGASGTAVLVRKFKVKQGNPDFANARGVGADDSEWIPLQWPTGWGNWRDLWWTVGNHGAYTLDENTLESDIVDVDFANKTITVPWGTRRGDGVMHTMKKKPGIAWIYDLNPNYEDSLTYAARTGDKLTVIVCGDEGYRATFDIIVSPPAADANIVVPVTVLNYPSTATQWWRQQIQEGLPGQGGWPRVTQNASGVDSIWARWDGIPYATSVDSLLNRLEKAPNAKWEIVPVDGTARPNLKNGDKLKVTAQNGAVKEYFIQVQKLQPSHNANLLAITWPDIPAEYRGLYGWIGDTIPGFNSTTYNYRVTVPMDVTGIPALVAKTQNLNATVKVTRASSLNGTTEQRTISFEVTAEDDSVKNIYNVELIKEKDPANIQPYYAEPFLSEYVFWDQWSNTFAEICNPGNQPLDLSNYMIASTDWAYNPADLIRAYSGPDDWAARYVKYVPGYKWVREAQWPATPCVLEQDLNVNAIVMPGDVFCLGDIYTTGFSGSTTWPVLKQLDIQFHNHNDVVKNPWNEVVNDWEGSPIRKWSNGQVNLYRILNDSIKLGLKPANDPNDFELIEVWGMGENRDWVVGGKTAAMITTWMRKPQIYKGNPIPTGSFGTNPDDSEWIRQDQPYWQARNAGWPAEILNITNDIGQHFMNEPTQYKSTVSSTVFQVSEGYTMNEKIIGMKTGTTVDDFLAGITKANDLQTLTVKRGDAVLALADALLANDNLVVLSADSVNTTNYVLSVTDEGLSSNAVLISTSPRYTVTIEQQPKSASATEEAGVGNVKGFDYGTALRTVLANLQVPAGATLTVINGQGAYVPLRTLNFDTTYVNVTVNDNIYLSVVAENGVTEIVYRLIPNVADEDAFVQSDLYTVVQRDLIIQNVPRGTRVGAFVTNVVPSAGATMKLVNKMGQERLDGDVADDDKVVVTSKNGAVTKTYYIAKLPTAATPNVTYLAYILSNVYAVDQVAYKVAGVDGVETVSNFLTRVTPAPGASVAVVDKDGVVKINGDINSTDKVKVTSADGKMNVFYTFGPLVSAKVVEAKDIQLYPNPTNGEINVSGLKAGYRIQVYNSVGVAIRDINVQNSIERISLRNQPAGMYMIVVSDNSNMLGRYKAMKQ
jgi:hypothetical protein